MDETQSLESKKIQENVVKITMNMIIQVLKEGLINKNHVRKEVLSRIKKAYPDVTERAMKQRWYKALEQLKESDRVSHVPETLHLIQYPINEEMTRIIETLNNQDDHDVIETMLLQLFQLSKHTHTSHFPKILDALNRIITKGIVFESHNILRNVLNIFASMLNYNYSNKPEGYEATITSVDNSITQIYRKVNCNRPAEIIRTAIDFVPDLSDSFAIVNSFFGLTECLNDYDFESMNPMIAKGLFYHRNKFARTHAKYIHETIIGYILGNDKRLKKRAKQLNSQESQYFVPSREEPFEKVSN